MSRARCDHHGLHAQGQALQHRLAEKSLEGTTARLSFPMSRTIQERRCRCCSMHARPWPRGRKTATWEGGARLRPPLSFTSSEASKIACPDSPNGLEDSQVRWRYGAVRCGYGGSTVQKRCGYGAVSPSLIPLPLPCPFLLLFLLFSVLLPPPRTRPPRLLFGTVRVSLKRAPFEP